jgi:hypothetical protein
MMADDVDIRIRLRDAVQAAGDLTQGRRGHRLDRRVRPACRHGRRPDGRPVRARRRPGRGRQLRHLGVGALGVAGVEVGPVLQRAGRERPAALQAVHRRRRRPHARRPGHRPQQPVQLRRPRRRRRPARQQRHQGHPEDAAGRRERRRRVRQGHRRACSQHRHRAVADRSRRAACRRRRSTSSTRRAPRRAADHREGLRPDDEAAAEPRRAGPRRAKAIRLLTKAWTSGKMAKAAERADQDARRPVAAAHRQRPEGRRRAHLRPRRGLERDVLPAANRAAQAITEDLRRQRPQQRAEAAPGARRHRPRARPVRRRPQAQDRPGRHPRPSRRPVGAAIPKMAAAAAAGAPHVASAFVHAWLHSGPWAQLLSRCTSAGCSAPPGPARSAKPVPVFVTNPGFGGMPGNGPARPRASARRCGSAGTLAPFAATRVAVRRRAAYGYGKVVDATSPPLTARIRATRSASSAATAPRRSPATAPRPAAGTCSSPSRASSTGGRRQARQPAKVEAKALARRAGTGRR